MTPAREGTQQQEIPTLRLTFQQVAQRPTCRGLAVAVHAVLTRSHQCL